MAGYQQVPIAIVGMGAIMPGATDVAHFWRCLIEGQDLITDVPENRWLIEDFYDPDPKAADKTYCRRGAFLPEVDFDPVAYGIVPKALPATDPTQMLALLVAETTLADVGGLASVDRERVSVILGSSTLPLAGHMSHRLERPVWRMALRELGLPESQVIAACDAIADRYVPWQESTFPGLLTNVVAGRIANRFDLHGTNCTVDAACASSFAALSMGIDQLALGRADMVLTGGVDMTNEPSMYLCFSKTPAMSASGDCRPFSDNADGTVLGEGLVMFALTRLADAEASGMKIHAVIRGLGSSSDGRSGSIYAPVAAGQVLAIRRAYAAAGYGPETVQLVEAHGTGTEIGDAAEFAAMREVFDATGRQDKQWCAFGSVKSQIGHTKCAAGSAGLLKAVLALQQKVFPPTIKVERPDPRLDLTNSPLYLNTAARPWIAPPAHPRRASVSSFGFGGTNFHVTLEEYAGEARSRRERAVPTELLLASGRSPEDLRATLVGGDLAELARTTQADFDSTAPVRLAIVASSLSDLRAKVERAIAWGDRSVSSPDGVRLAVGPASPGPVGFLFPGQGSQYVGMGADVTLHQPIAQATWDAAAVAAAELADVVFPPPVFTKADQDEQERRLTATEWAQPALAVTSLVLLEILRAVGVRPDAVAGHSFGELVALHAAGVFDAPTLLGLSRCRGQMIRDVVGDVAGTMMAVLAGPGQVDLTGLEDVWLANHNGPDEVVLSGTLDGIASAERAMTDRGLTVRRLNTSAAFHSPLVAAAVTPLRRHLATLAVSPPQLDVYGNTDATQYPTDADAIRDRIAGQLASPVRFVEMIEAMHRGGIRVFVEVGAGAVLTGAVDRVLGEADHAAVALDRRGGNGMTQLQRALGHLATLGVALDFARLWDEPPPERAKPVKSVTVTRIGTGTYARPYPPIGGTAALPPANPEPTAATTISVPHSATISQREPHTGRAAPDGDLLRVVEESQRYVAQAHELYQQSMADGHLAFLRMAENSIAAMAGQRGPMTTAWPSAAHDLASVPPLTATDWLSSGAAAPAPMLPAPATAAWQASAADVGDGWASGADRPPAGVPAMPATRAEVMALVLSVVADKTGYPVEVLGETMDMETDLGIDSIKRVEILASVREHLPGVEGLPTIGPEQTAELITLRSIAAIADRLYAAVEPDAAVSRRTELVPGAASPRDPTWHVVVPEAPDQMQRAPGAGRRSGGAQTPVVTRRVVKTVPAAANGYPLLRPGTGSVVITDDGGGVAEALASGLRSRGVPATVVAEMPADSRNVILLDGLGAALSVDEAVAWQRRAFWAARTVAAGMEHDGGVFVTVQDTGGDFGLGGSDPNRAWLGGLAGLARTAAREWPKAAVKAIDCERGGRDGTAVADAIIAELFGGGMTLDVGLTATGSRVTLEDVAVRAVADERPPAESPVLIVTGGARGITAAAVRAIADRFQPRLVLLGRTPLEPETDQVASTADEPGLLRLFAQGGTAPREAKRCAQAILAAREVRRTLADLARLGADVRYLALDVTDRAALAEGLREIRKEWGPIGGIVHAAGVLADKRIADKTNAQFDAVFDTKVVGMQALLEATVTDPLRLIVAFGSVAARFGNVGQCDYAMANETLTHVLVAEAARRPGCLVRSILWGPWAGGMVTEFLADQFRDAGVPVIPLVAGVEAFCTELSTGPGPVPVLLTAESELTMTMRVDGRTHPELADHAPTGVPVLPVASVLDWFIGAARQWCPSEPRTVLQDIRVLRRVDLPGLAQEGHALEVRGSRLTQNDGRLLTLELYGDGAVPHYRATVTTTSTSHGQWPELSFLERTTDIYDGHVLFHGPRYRAIQSIDGVSRAGAAGTVVGVAGLGWPARLWHLDPAAVDGSLQLAGLWASVMLGAAALPMAVAECRSRRDGPVTGPVRCIVRPGTVHPDTAICDVALLESDGTPLVELLGVTLVRRPR